MEICRFRLLAFLSILVIEPGICQKQNNNWFFGKNAGLDFSSGSPVPVSGSMDTWEGSASISDTSGNLLFYTDSKKIWDKNHNQMPNGSGLWGGGSSIQTLILPKPGSCNVFYIFTNDECSIGAANDRFSYTVVDMNLNDGLGNVDVSQKNIELFSKSTEGVTAAAHSNGIDIWVIAHKQNSNTFHTYLLSENGISTTPVVSTVGSTYDCQTTLKASPDGTKVGAISNGVCELFDFNNTTGTLSLVTDLDVHGGEFSLCFSPDNSRLYVGYVNKDHIDQFDITLSTSAAIIASHTPVYTFTTVPIPSIYGMQIGPDDKIYFNSGKEVGVINDPNILGTGCNVSPNQVVLNTPNKCNVGFINLFDGFKSIAINYSDPLVGLGNDTVICFGSSIVLKTSIAAMSYLWSTGASTSSISVSPSNTSIYSIEVNNICGNIGRDTVTVFVQPLPSVSIVGSALICEGQSVVLSADSPADSYLWNNLSSSPYIIVQPTTTTTYSLEITIGPCNATIAHTIEVEKVKADFSISDTSGYSSLIVDVNNNSVYASQYLWDFGDGNTSSNVDPSHTYELPGTYTISLIAYHLLGCKDTAYKTITVFGTSIYVPNTFTPNDDGLNDVLNFSIVNPHGSFSAMVYNRWGELLFKTTDSSIGWNGLYGQDPVKEDVYVWMVTYNENEFLGHVTLLR